MRLSLSPRLRAVIPLYFGDQPLTQAAIAARFGVQQSAISKRIRKVREAFRRAGIELEMPARPKRRLRPQTLSGVWDRRAREYLPQRAA